MASRSVRDGDRSTTRSDEPERRVPGRILLLELLAAGSPLSEVQLRRRTLLPESTVRSGLEELDREGVLSVRRPEHGPTRYYATTRGDDGD